MGQRAMRARWWSIALMACALACPKKPPPRAESRREPLRTAPLRAPPPTTETRTVVASHAREAAMDPRAPSYPENRAALLRQGFGATAEGPGEPIAGPGREGWKRLWRFAHVADVHLVDDESAARQASMDDAPPFAGAFRPEETFSCRVLDAAVRTIDALAPPVDFVLFGGDAVDDAQKNELAWFLSIVRGGAPVACDSGVPDDPVPGAGNDGKDPFVPLGLSVPWYWVTGNHDVLMQGNFPADASAGAKAIAARAPGGTRDWSKSGGPVVRGAVPPDPSRALLARRELLDELGEHAPGAWPRERARAYYAVDAPNGAPLRLLVLDTAAETGGAAGLVRRDDWDRFVLPELARAAADRVWLIVAAHHALDAIDDGKAFGGLPQTDAVPPAEIEQALVASGRVAAMLVGHGHRARVRRIGSDARGFWEVMTGALADWPAQIRVVEIDQDARGGLWLVSTMVDWASGEDAVLAEARALSALDWTSGWACCGPGERSDRNVALPLFRAP